MQYKPIENGMFKTVELGKEIALHTVTYKKPLVQEANEFLADMRKHDAIKNIKLVREEF